MAVYCDSRAAMLPTYRNTPVKRMKVNIDFVFCVSIVYLYYRVSDIDENSASVAMVARTNPRSAKSSSAGSPICID